MTRYVNGWRCDFQLIFGKNDYGKIGYCLMIGKGIDKTECVYGDFEIIGNIKPFSEWNECNVKFPPDTTKSWVFKIEGKNIPKDISFLYDTKNNIGDTLIFWDSDTTKHYFEKGLLF